MSSEQKTSVSILGVTFPNHVIVYSHKHGRELISATGANLMTMVKRMGEKSTRMREVAALSGPDGKPSTPVRGHLWFWRGIRDVMNFGSDQDADDQRPSKELARMFYGNTENPVIIHPDWVTELMTWLATQRVLGPAGSRAPREIVTSLADASEIFTDRLELTADGYRSLSFLAPARARVGEVQFFSSAALDDYDEYQTLLADKWKESVMSDKYGPMRVATRYIRFLNELNGGGFDIQELMTDVTDIEFEIY